MIQCDTLSDGVGVGVGVSKNNVRNFDRLMLVQGSFFSFVVQWTEVFQCTLQNLIFVVIRLTCNADREKLGEAADSPTRLHRSDG